MEKSHPGPAIANNGVYGKSQVPRYGQNQAQSTIPKAQSASIHYAGSFWIQ